MARRPRATASHARADQRDVREAVLSATALLLAEHRFAHGRLVELSFPDPRVDDARLAASFVVLHRLLSGPASVLEQQSALAAWWQDVARWSPAVGSGKRGPRDGDRAALRRALSGPC
jgi:hypothetical protein